MVEGAAMAKKHHATRASARQSGRSSSRAGSSTRSVHRHLERAARVPNCGKPTRVGHRIEDGRHEGAGLQEVRGGAVMSEPPTLHAAPEGAIPRRARRRSSRRSSA